MVLIMLGEDKASGYEMTPSILLDLNFVAALQGLQQFVLFLPLFSPSKKHLPSHCFAEITERSLKC